MNETEKQLMVVTTQVDTFEKAKELLADLEVLSNKYIVTFSISKNNQSFVLDEARDKWFPKDSDNPDGIGKDRPRIKGYCD